MNTNTRFRTVVVLWYLVAGAILAPGAHAVQPVSDDYKLGVGHYKQNRWDLAAESFRKFLKENPRHEKAEPARLYLGIALENDGKYEQARAVFREFVVKHPRSDNLPDAMYRVAECSYFHDDLKAAEGEFSAFLKKYPDHKLGEWAFPYLADSQLRQNNPQAALQSFQTAVQKYPRSELLVDSRFGMAHCHEQLKQFSRAADIYKSLSADRSAPRSSDAHLRLAAVYFDDGKYLEASRSYLDFGQRFPEHPQVPNAQLNAGYAIYELGDYAKAIAQFELAARSQPLAVTATYWKGVSLKSLNRHREAASVLESAFTSAGNTPLSSDILFQWADSELRGGRYETSRKLFLDYLKREPNGRLAADSLHFAAEASLLYAGELKGTQRETALSETQQLLDRFQREFADSRLRMHHELLKGRTLALRGGQDNLQAAVKQFRQVIDESTIPHTQSLARFQLSRTYEQLGEYRQAVESAAPLVELVGKAGADSEFIDVLILEGTSRFALKEFRDASDAMTLYLKLQPKGNQADQALATRAAANASLGSAGLKEEAQADLDLLSEKYPQSPLTLQARHQVAEIAYQSRDWTWSAELFQSLAENARNTPFHVLGLSGVAWSQFQQKQYLDAAKNFGRIVEQHPQEKILAPESAFKRGESLQNAERLEEAADAYKLAFQKFAPRDAAQPGDEQKKGSGFYAYRAGLQAARTLRQLKRVEEADAAYEQLLNKFPKPADLDNRLDEWALLNYESKNYKRSDEIFRRLLKETPQSKLADNARFSLAESDLQAGRLDVAQKTFRELEADAKADDEVRETSLHHLIGIAVERRDWKEVVAVSDQLFRRFPESTHRYSAEFYQAEARFQLNQLDQADETLSRLRKEIDPTAAEADWYPRVWILLAELQLRRKQYDDLEQTVEELHSKHPKSTLLYQADEILGRSFKNRARFDEARTAFQRVIDSPHGTRTETAAKSQFLIAETYLLQKQYREALRAYAKVYHLYQYPEWQAPALYQVGVCDEALGQWDNAVKSYEDLLKQFPKSEYVKQAESRLPVARKMAGR